MKYPHYKIRLEARLQATSPYNTYAIYAKTLKLPFAPVPEQRLIVSDVCQVLLAQLSWDVEKRLFINRSEYTIPDPQGVQVAMKGYEAMGWQQIAFSPGE